MILAQLAVYPIGESVSLGRFVKKGVKIIEESGYTYQVGGMSTSIEVPDLQSLFELVTKIRQAQLDEGAQRLIIELKVDERLDKEATLQGKITSVSSTTSSVSPISSSSSWIKASNSSPCSPSCVKIASSSNKEYFSSFIAAPLM